MEEVDVEELERRFSELKREAIRSLEKEGIVRFPEGDNEVGEDE